MKTVKILIGLLVFLMLIGARTSAAQTDQYPNELKDYEFFGKGKLASLKIGVSTKEDLKKLFGEKCEKICDYDADWLINFSFYENSWTKEEINSGGEKSIYYLKPEYLGKLRKIEITPKKQVSFSSISFPNAFQKLSRTQGTKSRNGKGKMTTYEVYKDSDGLTYELFGTTNDDTKNRNGQFFRPGDLVSIQYNLSREQERMMFSTRKNK